MWSLRGISSVKIHQNNISLCSSRKPLLIHTFSTSNGSVIQKKKTIQVSVPTVASQRVQKHLIQSLNAKKTWKRLTSYKKFCITRKNTSFEYKYDEKEDPLHLRHVVQLLPLDQFWALKELPTMNQCSLIEELYASDAQWHYSQSRQVIYKTIEPSIASPLSSEKEQDVTLFQRFSNFFTIGPSITTTINSNSSNSPPVIQEKKIYVVHTLNQYVLLEKLLDHFDPNETPTTTVFFFERLLEQYEKYVSTIKTYDHHLQVQLKPVSCNNYLIALGNLERHKKIVHVYERIKSSSKSFQPQGMALFYLFKAFEHTRNGQLAYDMLKEEIHLLEEEEPQLMYGIFEATLCALGVGKSLRRSYEIEAKCIQVVLWMEKYDQINVPTAFWLKIVDKSSVSIQKFISSLVLMDDEKPIIDQDEVLAALFHLLERASFTIVLDFMDFAMSKRQEKLLPIWPIVLKRILSPPNYSMSLYSRTQKEIEELLKLFVKHDVPVGDIGTKALFQCFKQQKESVLGFSNKKKDLDVFFKWWTQYPSLFYSELLCSLLIMCLHKKQIDGLEEIIEFVLKQSIEQDMLKSLSVGYVERIFEELDTKGKYDLLLRLAKYLYPFTFSSTKFTIETRKESEERVLLPEKEKLIGFVFHAMLQESFDPQQVINLYEAMELETLFPENSQGLKEMVQEAKKRLNKCDTADR